MECQSDLGGSPRIRHDLAELGMVASTATIRKYWPTFEGKPSHDWKTFLQSHAGAISAMDFFLIPNVTCETGRSSSRTITEMRETPEVLPAGWSFIRNWGPSPRPDSRSRKATGRLQLREPKRSK